jgi:Super-infection exclusion protein B
MACDYEQMIAMNAADPKWLEILKASGWQTAGLAAAAAALLYLNAAKKLSVPLDSWKLQAAEVSVVVFGSLSLFSIGPHFVKVLKRLLSWFEHRWAIRQAKHQVEKEIASMSPKEREIIGYLLAKNEKMFTYTSEGGYANTLISKRIVVSALVPGQSVTANFGWPFKVPDHVWDVLAKRKAEFPNTWKTGEPHPYAIHWMSR